MNSASERKQGPEPYACLERLIYIFSVLSIFLFVSLFFVPYVFPPVVLIFFPLFGSFRYSSYLFCLSYVPTLFSPVLALAAIVPFSGVVT
jgi:hypothetical protein